MEEFEATEVRFESDLRKGILNIGTMEHGGGYGMSVIDKHQEIHICAGCEWLAVETDSGGDFVGFCLHVKSENYRSPVSLIETCEAWEAWEAWEEADQNA